MASGWTDISGHGARFRLEGDVIRLSGRQNGTGSASTTPWGSLPSAAWPTYTYEKRWQNSSGTGLTLQIATNGGLSFSSSMVNGGAVYIDSVVYPLS